MISRAKDFALPLLIAFALITGGAVRVAVAEEDLGTKIKRIFEPTPPPKKKKTVTKKKTSPTPSPSPTPKKKSAEEVTPSPSPKKKATPEPESSPSPSPKKKKAGTAKKSPTPSPTPEPSETPTPKPKSSPSPSPGTKHKKKASPTPEPSVTPSPSPSATPEEEEEEAPEKSPSPKRTQAPGATISPNDIIGIDNYAPEIRKVIDAALLLTTRNLEYKYGSADPESGGLDCSGFIYYVLKQQGLKDVPRDASGQYSWLRKEGKFQAVISRNDSTFELED